MGASFLRVLTAVPAAGVPLELWPGALGASGHEEPAARLLTPGDPCADVHDAMLRLVDEGGRRAAAGTGALVELVPSLVQALDEPLDPEEQLARSPYAVFFGEAARATQLALDVAQALGLAVMTHRRCFSSSARLALGKALAPLQKALRHQISTMWWMFDIGQFSNTNNPSKHLEAVFKAVRFAEAMFEELAASLPAALASRSHFWGHEANGMFINSTVIYRTIFPEAALLDKGLLRCLLGILPRGTSLADFGALDGQYSRWLNDTGWVTAYAFDGVQGVSEITGGVVSQVDLAQHFRVPWHNEPFGWVLCLEVAEHIPARYEQAFLANLDRHASEGLVLSWAPPEVEGEGHVNCQAIEESRRRIEALGFRQDSVATEALRAASDLSWIRASVAVYRRLT